MPIYNIPLKRNTHSGKYLEMAARRFSLLFSRSASSNLRARGTTTAHSACLPLLILFIFRYLISLEFFWETRGFSKLCFDFGSILGASSGLIFWLHSMYLKYFSSFWTTSSGNNSGLSRGAFSYGTAAAVEQPITPPVKVDYTQLLINGNFVDSASGELYITGHTLLGSFG